MGNTISIDPNNYGRETVDPDNPHNSSFGVGGKVNVGPYSYGGTITTNGSKLGPGFDTKGKMNFGEFGKFAYDPYNNSFTAAHPSGGFISIDFDDGFVSIGLSKSLGSFAGIKGYAVFGNVGGIGISVPGMAGGKSWAYFDGDKFYTATVTGKVGQYGRKVDIKEYQFDPERSPRN